MRWHERLVILVMTSALLLEASCIDIAGKWTRDEVSRITSPSGEVDAVLVEENGGPTISAFGYQVFLVKSGEKYDSGIEAAYIYGAVRSEHAWGVDLDWIEPKVLSVEYLRAKAEAKVTSPIQINGEEFEIRLKSGIEDPKALSGGMLYNLQKSSGFKQ